MLGRGRVKERERGREKHWLDAFHMLSDCGSNLQCKYVSWLGTEPAIFLWLALNQLSHAGWAGVCSFKCQLRQASCYHVTWPLAGEDDEGRSQVTPINLSPAPAIFTASLFLLPNLTEATADSPLASPTAFVCCPLKLSSWNCHLHVAILLCLL